MLGVEDYGSDNDSDTDGKKSTIEQRAPPLKPPPPKSKRGTKKIMIGLPALPPELDDNADAEGPPAKKPRLHSGAGSSSLINMLPPPNISVERMKVSPKPIIPNTRTAPPVDFFALDSTSPPRPPELQTLPPSVTEPASSAPKVRIISSAPEVEDFIPPEPTPTDPYPGYYLLPSGSWAAYEQVYYQTFYKKWETEYNAHVRALEKGTVKGFEDLETAGTQDVDAMKEMEKAKREIQEREDKKAVTHGAGGGLTAPRMNIQGAKLGNRARSRHQLSTLLNDAYENRETLEEKIAEGRRNRKEAGNKYGF